jgi:carboxypeptidase family protein
MTRLRSLVLLLIATIPVAAQQPPPPPTGIIRGRVVSSDGRPVKQMIVRAVGSGTVAGIAETGRGMQRGALTDAEGRFELKDLAGDTYTIMVFRSGYVTIDPATRRMMPGKRVRLADGDVLERVEVVVGRTSAIVGRVTDEDGEPVEGAAVQPLRVAFANGHRQVIEAGRSRVTNDLGHFRLYGLPPGQYVLSVQPATTGMSRMPGYPLTYYPGSPALADAQFVAVDIGHDAPGVDVRISPGRTARVSGIALDASGRPLNGTMILAHSQRSGGVSAAPRQISLQNDGTFTIAGVGPGEYVLQSLAFTGDDHAQFATQFVSVGEDDAKGLVLRASEGSTVSGRITIEGDASTIKPSAFRIWPFPSDFDLAPMIGNGYRATVQPDWTFSMKGLFGPLVFRLLDGPAGWMIKTVRSGAADVTDTPLMFGRPNQSLDDVEIVVTNRSASVSGTASDLRGQPLTDYTVIVFAVNKERWYRESRLLKYAIAEPDGSFSIRGLPAAEYFVAAVDWMEPTPGFGDWQDPEILEALARRATRVTLKDAQRVQLALKVIPR